MFEVCNSCGWGCFVVIVIALAGMGAFFGAFIAMIIHIHTDGIIDRYRAIAIIVVCSIIITAVMFPPLPINNVTINKIHSMEDDFSISGSFILGSGTMHGESAYFYYEIMDDGGLEQRYLYSEQCTQGCGSRETVVRVYQDENESPYVKKIYTDSYCGGSTRYEIHVPSNTVRRHYNLDSED